jgi:CRP-like cAMP-binding protein
MAGAPLELVSQVDLFHGLGTRELKEIAGSMKQHRYEPGRAIVSEGEGGVGFFVISEGTATVSVGGQEVATLGPGSSFGEVALVSEAKRTATVTAESELSCWSLTSWAFRPIVETHPAMAWTLLQEFGRRLAER